MPGPKFEQLKQKYEEARSGLDHLQEEVLARGMELRPGLRRQFEEALRALFYTMACADGRIDESEVRFYNFLFDEELSVASFELVRAQLARTHRTFEEDLLSTVASFAAYDKAITGAIPLGAPALSTLLISAAEAVGRLVMTADGEIHDAEAETFREVIQRARQRADLVRADAEALMREGVDEGYDPDAALGRDLRGVERFVCVALTEAVLHGADVVVASGIGASDEPTAAAAVAAQFVAGEVRDDLERGKASVDLATFAATQVAPVLAALGVLARWDGAPGWATVATESSDGIRVMLSATRDSTGARLRVLREKHDWHPDIAALEESFQQVWETLT